VGQYPRQTNKDAKIITIKMSYILYDSSSIFQGAFRRIYSTMEAPPLGRSSLVSIESPHVN